MLKIASLKETAEFEKHLNDWFIHLDPQIKADIYQLITPLLDKMSCYHQWKNNTQWQQDNRKMEYCRKCGWSRERK